MRLSVFALAGTTILATCTIAAADDNGALTGAAGGRRHRGRRRWTGRGRCGRCSRCGHWGRNNRGPATCCCRTRARALCDQNDNADEQQYGR